MRRRDWLRLDEMDAESKDAHIVHLRSEVTNLRIQIDRYRSMVRGMRGSIHAISAILGMETGE